MCLVDPARVAEETKRVSTRLERCKLILELESLPSADAQEPSNHAPISTLPLPSPSHSPSDVAPPHAPLPLQPRGPSALQVRLNESEETNRKQALEMEEIKRELASLKSLSVGQLGHRKNLPAPQHAQVPGLSLIHI